MAFFPHRIEFKHAQEAKFDEPLSVGDALRWVGPGVWQIEEIDGERVTVRLWPDDEPYPARITDCGPGEWPGEGKP